MAKPIGYTNITINVGDKFIKLGAIPVWDEKNTKAMDALTEADLEDADLQELDIRIESINMVEDESELFDTIQFAKRK